MENYGFESRSSRILGIPGRQAWINRDKTTVSWPTGRFQNIPGHSRVCHTYGTYVSAKLNDVRHSRNNNNYSSEHSLRVSLARHGMPIL